MLITSGRLRVSNDAGRKLAEVKTAIVGAYLGDWQSDYLPMLRGWLRFVWSGGLRRSDTWFANKASGFTSLVHRHDGICGGVCFDVIAEELTRLSHIMKKQAR